MGGRSHRQGFGLKTLTPDTQATQKRDIHPFPNIWRNSILHWALTYHYKIMRSISPLKHLGRTSLVGWNLPTAADLPDQRLLPGRKRFADTQHHQTCSPAALQSLESFTAKAIFKDTPRREQKDPIAIEPIRACAPVRESFEDFTVLVAVRIGLPDKEGRRLWNRCLQLEDKRRTVKCEILNY